MLHAQLHERLEIGRDSARETPDFRTQAGGGVFDAGMVLAVEPGIYWPGGGGLRVEDNFLVTAAGAEKLSAFPDGVVSCD